MNPIHLSFCPSFITRVPIIWKQSSIAQFPLKKNLTKLSKWTSICCKSSVLKIIFWPPRFTSQKYLLANSCVDRLRMYIRRDISPERMYWCSQNISCSLVALLKIHNFRALQNNFKKLLAISEKRIYSLQIRMLCIAC